MVAEGNGEGSSARLARLGGPPLAPGLRTHPCPVGSDVCVPFPGERASQDPIRTCLEAELVHQEIQNHASSIGAPIENARPSLQACTVELPMPTYNMRAQGRQNAEKIILCSCLNNDSRRLRCNVYTAQ